MGIKPSDFRTVPLTDLEHQRLHNIGEQSYWESVGVNPIKIIIALLTKFVGSGRCEDIDTTDTDRTIEALIKLIES